MAQNMAWTEWVDQMKQAFHGSQPSTMDSEKILVGELTAAQKEWDYAKQYFNTVTDPDLIDLAIFNIGMAEKKYVYLLKKARESGTCIERFKVH